MHTLAPGARGPFKRRRGKNISSLSNSKRVEKDHAIQFHTHLLHHRRGGGNLRRVTSLERGGDRGGSSRRTQTHLLGDRLESSGSSYRRHFLFSCCVYILTTTFRSGFLQSSLPNLPLDFIHSFLLPKQTNNKKFCWTLDSLFYLPSSHFCSPKSFERDDGRRVSRSSFSSSSSSSSSSSCFFFRERRGA